MKQLLDKLTASKLNKTELGIAGVAITAIVSIDADPNIKVTALAAIAIGYAFARAVDKGLSAIRKQIDEIEAPEVDE